MRNLHAGSPDDTINLDPFIDIVTNVIGALFFMILFVALAALDVRHVVLTPVVSAGETDPVVFICNENRVFHPDVEGLREEFVAKAEELEKRLTGISVMDQLGDLTVSNANYTMSVRFTVTGDFALVCERLPDAVGDGPEALAADGGDGVFATTLRMVNPDTHHLFFLVEADSFEVFQAARTRALQEGFGVGWEPYPGGPLVQTKSGNINPGSRQL